MTIATISSTYMGSAGTSQVFRMGDGSIKYTDLNGHVHYAQHPEYMAFYNAFKAAYDASTQTTSALKVTDAMTATNPVKDYSAMRFTDINGDRVFLRRLNATPFIDLVFS